MCCYTTADGQRIQRSVGTSDKDEATAICRRWQNEANALRGNDGTVNALTDPEIREMVPDPGKGEPMKSPSRILMK